MAFADAFLNTYNMLNYWQKQKDEQDAGNSARDAAIAIINGQKQNQPGSGNSKGGQAAGLSPDPRITLYTQQDPAFRIGSVKGATIGLKGQDQNQLWSPKPQYLGESTATLNPQFSQQDPLHSTKDPGGVSPMFPPDNSATKLGQPGGFYKAFQQATLPMQKGSPGAWGGLKSAPGDGGTPEISADYQSPSELPAAYPAVTLQKQKGAPGVFSRPGGLKSAPGDGGTPENSQPDNSVSGGLLEAYKKAVGAPKTLYGQKRSYPGAMPGKAAGGQIADNSWLIPVLQGLKGSAVYKMLPYIMGIADRNNAGNKDAQAILGQYEDDDAGALPPLTKWKAPQQVVPGPALPNPPVSTIGPRGEPLSKTLEPTPRKNAGAKSSGFSQDQLVQMFNQNVNELSRRGYDPASAYRLALAMARQSGCDPWLETYGKQVEISDK